MLWLIYLEFVNCGVCVVRVLYFFGFFLMVCSFVGFGLVEFVVWYVVLGGYDCV